MAYKINYTDNEEVIESFTRSTLEEALDLISKHLDDNLDKLDRGYLATGGELEIGDCEAVYLSEV